MAGNSADRRLSSAWRRAIKDSFKLALAQLNPVVGDIEGNVRKARAARATAAAAGADLIVFTELYLTGYPIEDLVLKPALQQAARAALRGACPRYERRRTRDADGAALGRRAVRLQRSWRCWIEGRIEALRFKYNLPNYGVFDEKRVFAPGRCRRRSTVRGFKLGVPVCEDIWSEEVCRALAEAGADCSSCPTARPIGWTSTTMRYDVAETRVAETGLPLAYVNQVGGQDELVFDGASFVLNADGRLAVQLPAWEEALGVTEWRREERTLALPAGRHRRGRAGRRRELPRLRHGLARLCREERLPRRGARALRRHRLGAVRGDGGRCARRQTRAWRHAALHLHQQ